MSASMPATTPPIIAPKGVDECDTTVVTPGFDVVVFGGDVLVTVVSVAVAPADAIVDSGSIVSWLQAINGAAPGGGMYVMKSRLYW